MQNTGPEVNINLRNTSPDSTRLTLIDEETDEEIESRYLPKDMAVPEVGDALSVFDMSMSGEFEGETDVSLDEPDGITRYEVVSRRMNYVFVDLDLDDKDVEEAVMLRANVVVEEAPLEESE